jgi:predicted Fe-Mo cluster-binding NifX family protein
LYPTFYDASLSYSRSNHAETRLPVSYSSDRPAPAREMHSLRVKGDGTVRIGLTVWENRISPLFDSARMLLVVEIEKGVVVNKRYAPLDSEPLFSRITALSKLGVRVLLCGAVSEFFANTIEAQGIRIIPFITGDVDRVLSAYLTGQLPMGSFQMPGCSARRRRRFRGGRGGPRGARF